MDKAILTADDIPVDDDHEGSDKASATLEKGYVDDSKN